VRVFLDANVLFSAATPDSATRTLLNHVVGKAEAVTNEHAWEEARRNIELKRPHLAAELMALRSKIHFSSRLVFVRTARLPAKDHPILGGAIAAKCTHLWTGDKRHFGALYGDTIQGVRIVSGVMLADELHP
jgi:uncharacterized protein